MPLLSDFVLPSKVQQPTLTTHTHSFKISDQAGLDNQWQDKTMFLISNCTDYTQLTNCLSQCNSQSFIKRCRCTGCTVYSVQWCLIKFIYTETKFSKLVFPHESLRKGWKLSQKRTRLLSTFYFGWIIQLVKEHEPITQFSISGCFNLSDK